MKASFARLGRKGGLLAKSRLLNLPVDIITQVLRQLPRHSLLLVSESCRILRRLCQLLGQEPLSREEYLLYLTSHSHGTLDRWVCWRCMKLHDFSIPSDRPTKPSSMAQADQCPLDWLSAFQMTYHAGSRDYALSHQIVQFALKFRRMHPRCTDENPLARLLRCLRPHRRERKKRWQELFLRVMAPYQTTVYTNPMCPGYTAEYLAVPKISGGSFLLHCSWRYWLPQQERHDWTGDRMLGYVKICAHQGHFYGLTMGVSREKRDLALVLRHMAPEEQVQYDVVSAWLWLDRESQIRSENKLPDLIHDAKRNRHLGAEVSGSCTKCYTDFTVQSYTGGELVVRSWHDLGGDSSPLDRAWASQMMGCEGWRSSAHDEAHRPGSVRLRFEAS